MIFFLMNDIDMWIFYMCENNIIFYNGNCFNGSFYIFVIIWLI